MDWFILGIEPTKDKCAITAAYRQKLRQTNPEERPEEFKQLRAAYEEALALADQAEAPRDESPVGIWMEAVSALYGDYAARIDPARWQALMRDDVCIGLDTRPAAEEALLKFLMESYFLPQRVWVVLDETFGFSQRLEELYEAYPRDFIDQAVLNGIRLDPSLSYDLFDPGVNAADCDAYRRLYAQALRTDPAQLAPILEQLDALSEGHPYGEALRCRYQMATGKKEEATRGFRRLAEQYPADALMVLNWASLCLEDGQAEEAAGLAGQVLDREPDSVHAKSILARSLAQQGLYQDAKELTFELIRASAADPILTDQFAQLIQQWNSALIAQREIRYADCPEDTENAVELAWCYIQNERPEEAMALALKLDPEKTDPFSYHNLLGKLYHREASFDQALEHLLAVEGIIREMVPDGARETERRIRRLPEMLQIAGDCLMQLKQPEPAREKLSEALDLAPEDPEVLTIMGKILFSTGDYGGAVQVLERLLQGHPDSWYAAILMSLSFYRMRRYREAFDSANRALAMRPGELSMYIMKLQILVRNHAWDEVRQILEFLENAGAPEDVSIDFIKAQLTELEGNNVKKAFGQYQKIARRVEAGENLFLPSELYYRMAYLMSKEMNTADHEDRELLILQLDKGLAHDPLDESCLDFKAWLLKKDGQLDEAIELYRELAEKYPHALSLRLNLAKLYCEDLTLYAREGLECCEALLKEQPTAELYFHAACCRRQLGDLEGARSCYMKQLEMDPDDVDGYNGLAYICDSQGAYGESLAHIDRALEIMEACGQTYPVIIEHKVKVLRRMGRYDEALAFVDTAMERWHYRDGCQLKFDICCQFGLWDRAKLVLEQWKQADKNDPALMKATGRLYLLTGKLFKAAFAMGPAKRRLSQREVEDFRIQLVDLECDYARQIQLWTIRSKQEPDNYHPLVNLAQAMWNFGLKEAARVTAEKALAILDDTLEADLTDEALYRSTRSLVLALLGREAEARAELEKTRSLPLCDFCEYGRCKDADIYEAAIEEILGNREKALSLYRMGRANWPDDLDFASGEARMKKKGR